jgi:Zn-dependent metalloprotease
LAALCLTIGLAACSGDDTPTGSGIDPAVVAAESFVASRFDSLGLQPDHDRMDSYQVETDRSGYRHVRMNQYHDRVRVERGQLVVHVAEDLTVGGLSGGVSNIVGLNVTPDLTRTAAFSIARNHMTAQGYEPYPELTGELVIFHWQSEDFLCWRSLLNTDGLARYEYYVDAHTGDIVYVRRWVIS